MNMDRQRFIALEILKFAVKKAKDEDGEKFDHELKEVVKGLCDTIGDDGAKLFSDAEISAFVYSLDGRSSPPAETIED